MPVGGYPAVLGHEGVGIVRWVGGDAPDDSLKPGHTVLLYFHSCCKWKACLAGQKGSCPHMTETNFINTARGPGSKSPISLPDGTGVHGQFFGQSSLSKLAIVTKKCLVRLDASPIELQYLAPLGCGYSTGAGTIINVLKPKVDESVAILGMGAVGLAALMAAKALGVHQIIAVDLLDSKLQMAGALGATQTINTSFYPDLKVAIRDVCPSGVDKIVDTTGAARLLEDSVEVLAHRGILALVGVPSPTASLNINALGLLLGCKQIVGVIEGAADPQVVINFAP